MTRQRRVVLILFAFYAAAAFCGCGFLGIGRRDPRELASPLPDVRREALLSLAERGEAAAPIVVQYLAKDEDALVRATAAVILGDLRWREAVPHLSRAVREDESSIVRADACTALARISDASAAPAVAVALRDMNEDVRRAAAHALGRLGERATIPALIAALDDKEYGVRLAARSSLETITGQTLSPNREDWLRWLQSQQP